MSSSLKLLQLFSPDFTRGLLSEGYGKFVQMVPHHRTKWPQCPYMVKTLKNFRLQNQESFGTESWFKASRTNDDRRLTFDLFRWGGWVVKVYQICSNDDRRLTFDLFTLFKWFWIIEQDGCHTHIW